MFSVVITHHLSGQPVQCSHHKTFLKEHEVPPSPRVFPCSSKILCISAAKIEKGTDEEFGDSRGWAPTGSVLLAVELNPAQEQPGLDHAGDVEEVSVTC